MNNIISSLSVHDGFTAVLYFLLVFHLHCIDTVLFLMLIFVAGW